MGGYDGMLFVVDEFRSWQDRHVAGTAAYAEDEAQQNVQARKQAAQPKPEQPSVPSIKRNAPNKPEPSPQTKRSEPRKQAAPAVTQPQPVPPAKAKGKGKGKDEKKDAAKPEDAPQ